MSEDLSRFLGKLAAGAMWIFSLCVVALWIATRPPGLDEKPWIAPVLSALTVCIPLALFRIAAEGAKSCTAKPSRQVLFFYAFTLLIWGGLVVLLLVVWPSPPKPDPALRTILQLIVIPGILSSIVYASIVLGWRTGWPRVHKG